MPPPSLTPAAAQHPSAYLRSVDTVVHRRVSCLEQSLREVHFPLDERWTVLPSDALNPSNAFAQAFTAVKKWAADTTLGGGGWGAVANGYDQAVLSGANCHGLVKKLKCSHQGEPPLPGADVQRQRLSKCYGCTWAMRLEMCWDAGTTEILILVSGAKLAHHRADNSVAHALQLTAADARADPTTRFIPPDLLELGNKLRGLVPIGRLHHIFESIVQKRNDPVTWELCDVANKFGLPPGEIVCDASNFADLLTRRTAEDGLYAAVLTDDIDTLQCAFWEIAGAKGHALRCVTYDNTFNTNRYGYKLGIGVGVDGNGKSRCLFVTLLVTEDEHGFKFVLNHFKKAFTAPPAAIITDGDPILARAIKSAWLFTKHNLCTWHISKTLLRNLKHIFGTHRHGTGGNKGWVEFLHAWWVVCKQSDLHSIKDFDDEWAALVRLLKANVTDPSDLAKALHWCVQCSRG